MPFARLTLAGAPAGAADLPSLAAAVAALVAETLRKDPARTSVLVEAPSHAASSVAGAPAPLVAHLEVIVTAGTNSDAEKRAFLAAADALLRRALGALPEATYVVVREVAADAWGFGGRTQADRKAAGTGL